LALLSTGKLKILLDGKSIIQESCETKKKTKNKEKRKRNMVNKYNKTNPNKDKNKTRLTPN